MISKQCLDTIFLSARSQNGWLNKTVSSEQLQQIYNLLKFAPTSANCCPLRITFITSKQAKQRLKPHLDEGNIKKSMTAPAVAIIAYDSEFYEKLPRLFPHTDAKSWFVGNPEKIKSTAIMNTTLQGAYFIIATRSIGLECGPMGGFNNKTLDAEFFSNGKTKSIFLCGIGYGDSTKILPRSPRLDFNEVCEII